MRLLICNAASLVAALALINAELAAQPTARGTVQVAMEDGKTVSGILQLNSVRIKTELGVLEIEAGKLRSLRFGKDGDSVVTSAKTVTGKIVTEEFKLRTEEGVLTLARDKLRTITFAEPPAIADKDAPKAKETPKKDVPTENELRPVAVIKLDATLPAMILSRDRQSVYLLNGTAAKIQRLDTAKRALATAAAEVTNGTEGMCLTPDGKILYTFASPAGHKYYDKNPETGKIQVFDAATVALKNTFALAYDPFGIAATDAGRLFLTNGSNQWTTLATVDVKKQALVGQLGGVRHRSILRMSADQRRLYWSTTDTSPGNVQTALLPPPPVPAEPQEIDKLIGQLDSTQFAERNTAQQRLEAIAEYALEPLRKAVAANPGLDLRQRLDKLITLAEQRLQGTAENYSSPYHGEYPLGGRFEVSPDGKYLIFASGTVLHAGRDKADDLRFAAKVEPHVASAMDKDSKVLLLSTQQRTLQVYSSADFKLQKSLHLEGVVSQMVFDAASGTLYCAVETKQKAGEGQPGMLSDLWIYDLKQALKMGDGK